MELLDEDGITGSDEEEEQDGLSQTAGHGIGMHPEASQQGERREIPDQCISDQNWQYTFKVKQANLHTRSLMRRKLNSAADAVPEEVLRPCSATRNSRSSKSVLHHLQSSRKHPLTSN